jgi:hypothetical protein
MSDPSDIPTSRSIVEGTIAQVLGGSMASVIILTMASFGHYVAAGLESALGTFFGVLFYIAFKSLRMTRT